VSILERFVELHPRSAELHERALSLFPDGVTHDIRAFTPFPLYVEHADGARKWDVDGNEIVDYVMGHGALLLGHAYPAVVEAVQTQAPRGFLYGASHEREVRWAELVRKLVPSVERLRFAQSGTEATMMALRLARAATGREKVLRLVEHFHGWNDSVTGQPAREETVPAAPGLPRGILEASIVIPQNDAIALERTLEAHGDEIAALIFEATGMHWGTEPIDLEYVRRARELTRQRGIVLIFDEVITGFRVSAGGAQREYGVTPDLTTFAKILGGGVPAAAVGGRAELLDQISISADHGRARVAHPGTYNANALSAAAGTACLETISDGGHQARAAATAADLARAMNAILREESVAGCVYGQSSMLHVALGLAEQPPDGYSWGYRALPTRPPAVRRDTAMALRRGMLNEGVDMMGSGMMVSSVHGPDDVARTADAFRRTIRAMKAERLAG
jgi:glutamate-1-semialdehyde 2,1-aminomutase